MDESPSVELLSARSHNNNNNNNDRKSENATDKNANPIDSIAQNELLDNDSSDFDFDSLDGDQTEIDNMLQQAMDSNASENETNANATTVTIALGSHNNTIDDAHRFKQSTIDNNHIPTTSNNQTCHSNPNSNDNDNTIQIERHSNAPTEPKPADNHSVQDNASNVSIIDVNNEHYDSAEEGEPIFDFLGKANEIVCCVIYFPHLHYFHSFTT